MLIQWFVFNLIRRNLSVLQERVVFEFGTSILVSHTTTHYLTHNESVSNKILMSHIGYDVCVWCFLVNIGKFLYPIKGFTAYQCSLQYDDYKLICDGTNNAIYRWNFTPLDEWHHHHHHQTSQFIHKYSYISSSLQSFQTWNCKENQEAISIY